MVGRFGKNGKQLEIFIILFLIKKKNLKQKEVCEGIISESHFSNIISGKYDFDREVYDLILERVDNSGHFKNLQFVESSFEHFFIDNIYEILEMFSCCQFETAIKKLEYINFEIFYSLKSRISCFLTIEEMKIINTVQLLKNLYQQNLETNQIEFVIKEVRYYFDERLIQSSNCMLGLFFNEINYFDNNKTEYANQSLYIQITECIKKLDFRECLRILNCYEKQFISDNSIKIIKSFCLLSLEQNILARQEMSKIKGKVYNEALNKLYMFCWAQLDIESNSLQYEEIMKICYQFFENCSIQKVIIEKIADFYYKKRQYKKASEYLLELVVLK